MRAAWQVGSAILLVALVGAASAQVDSYRVRADGSGAAVAGNERHSLSVHFDESSVRIRHRNGGRANTVALTLAGYGHRDRLEPPPPRLRQSWTGTRLERSYGEQPAAPALTEWFVNSPHGLEQGFTLHRPPAAGDPGAPVVLELAVAGDLVPAMAPDARGVVFGTPRRPDLIRWGGLRSFDATGRALPSRVAVEGTRLRLEIAAADAIYPITVDPLFTSSYKLLAVDGAANDNFGASVAVDGDTLWIGAPFDDAADFDSGSAHVYVRRDTTWQAHQHIVPLDGQASDLFGKAVALDGDTAVVGAFGDDDGGVDAGSAYVYVRSGDDWVLQAKLLAADAAPGDRFGWSVALDGDTAVIGAYFDDDNGDTSGSAYVFVRDSGAWSQQAKLLPDDGEPLSVFGVSVAVDGDTVLVGASATDTFGLDSGAAYVFERAGDAWSQTAKLLPADPGVQDQFGISVAVVGDVALIGANLDDDNGEDSGSVYEFTRTGGAWSQTQKLVAGDGTALDQFGYSLALQPDVALVGAYFDDNNGAWSGSGYVFVRSGGVWTENQKLLAYDGASNDQYSVSVDVDGALTGVLGSWRDGDRGTFSGSVYVYGTSPACDVELSQASYAPGEAVVVEHLWLRNSDKAPAALEWKSWFVGLDGSSYPVTNVGANGTIVFPPGLEIDLGPWPLLTVAPGTPPGTYGFDCRLVDPATGRTYSLDTNRFEVQ